MSTSILLAAGVIAAFAAVTVGVMAVETYLLERRQVYRSLRAVRTYDLNSPGDIRHQALSAPATTRLLVPTLRRLGNIGRRVTPAGVIERLEEELGHAGNPAGWDAERVLAFKVMLPLLLGGGWFLTALVVGAGAIQTIVITALFVFVGYYLPEWVVRSKAGTRQKAIQRALPDALDLLSITVEAGLGFDAALARVAKETGGPLGEEFYRVVQEIQFGSDRVRAMRALGERNAVQELKSFVLAMVQADVLGISVSKVLAIQAKEIRTKRRQRAEEQAQKLPVKLVFPLIFCVFPALFVVLLGPAAIQISKTVLQVF